MKPKLILSANNVDTYNYVCFKKDKALLPILKEMTRKVYPDDVYVDSIFDVFDFDLYKSKKKIKKIRTIVDERYTIATGKFVMDLIFGKNKVFLIMNGDKKVLKTAREYIKNNLDFEKENLRNF